MHAARRNEQLKKEVATLKQQLVHLEETSRSNRRLRSLLGLKEKPTISRWWPPRWWAATSPPISAPLLSTRALQDGLKTQMPVVHTQGVVGKIIWVSPNYAKVLLIVDPNSGVDVINQRSRARGIAEGVGKNGLRLKYVQHNS